MTAPIILSTQKANTCYASVERVLDIAGYVPVVSEFSSAIRFGMGSVQLVHSFALATFATLRRIATITSDADSESPTRHNLLTKALARNAIDLAKNGTGNIVRAIFEASGPVGGILCLVFDFFKSQFSASHLGNLYGRNIKSVEIHRPVIAEFITASITTSA